MKQLQSALSGLVVIVIGVLLALAGEAAWAERGERAREQEILADLLEEFRENEARLLTDMETNRQARAAADIWVQVVFGETSVPPDSLFALADAAQGDARFDPVTGALRSLVDGGELGVIRNDELRRALAGWSDRVEEARMTAASYDNLRSNLSPLIYSLNPGEPIGPGPGTAVEMAAAASGRHNFQLTALAERIGEIIALVESEME
ncbi:MAG: hypothetical protein ABFS34_04890 [Gemmatimonadota bacterium]